MKRQIILLQGPPRSGKTTWANEHRYIVPVDTYVYTISTKDLVWKKTTEGYIIDTLDSILGAERDEIMERLSYRDINWDIIIDAHNVNPQRIQEFEKLANEMGAELVIKQFYIPYSESYKRNKEVGVHSKEYIPQGVLAKFYDTFYHERYRDELIDKRVIRQPEPTLPPCIICDLDATLALHQGREPFEWDSLLTDKIDPRLRDLLNLHMTNGTKVFFLTGRTKHAQRDTLKWLQDPKQGLCDKWELIIRSRGDFSSGEIYKRKMYEQQIQGMYNVLCVFEDSNKCVSMWRELGLLTCQVANSDY